MREKRTWCSQWGRCPNVALSLVGNLCGVRFFFFPESLSSSLMWQSPLWLASINSPTAPAMMVYSSLPQPLKILWPQLSPRIGWSRMVVYGVPSQFCYPLASPAGAVWLLSSELGHIVFSFGASAMTCRHQEKFQVTLCLVPLSQMLNF